MNLSDYYKKYYNGHQYRDAVFRMRTATGDKAYPLNYNPAYDTDYPYEKFRKFLTKPQHHISNSDLLVGISWYSNYNTWVSKEAMNVCTDRLFFDFDLMPNYNDLSHEAKSISKSVINAIHGYDTDTESKVTGKDRTKAINKYRRQYQHKIFKEDVLKPVFDEVMRFIKVMEDDLKLHPYLTFSGSSGFHVNFFMPDVKLPYINYVREHLHEIFKKKLNLIFQDDKVLDAATRKQRVPYSRNPKSDLYVRPLPADINYDEMLKLIKRSSYRVDDFTIEDYYVTDEFIDKLKFLNNNGRDAAIKEREKAARLTKNMPKHHGNKKYKGMINITKPEDVMNLLSFQCFKNMEWSDYNNLLLVNLLWNTGIGTAEDIQKAMIYFWNDKGIKLKPSAAGLKRVKSNKHGKYAPTNNTMKKHEYCTGCNDWRECFRYKLILSDEYRNRLHNFKEMHS